MISGSFSSAEAWFLFPSQESQKTRKALDVLLCSSGLLLSHTDDILAGEVYHRTESGEEMLVVDLTILCVCGDVCLRIDKGKIVPEMPCRVRRTSS